MTTRNNLVLKEISFFSLIIAGILSVPAAMGLVRGIEVNRQYGAWECQRADRELAHAFRDAVTGGNPQAVKAAIGHVKDAETGVSYAVKCRLPATRHQMALFGYS